MSHSNLSVFGNRHLLIVNQANLTTWVQVITLVCTIVTVLYAIHKYNDSRRPLLFIYTSCAEIPEIVDDSGQKQTMRTVVFSVKNIGKRPAKNIRIRIYPPFLHGTTEYYQDYVSILLPEGQHDVFKDYDPNYWVANMDNPLLEPRRFVIKYRAPGKWFLPYLSFQRVIAIDALSVTSQRRRSGAVSATIKKRTMKKRKQKRLFKGVITDPKRSNKAK